MDIDGFLQQRIDKKLEYWTKTKINSAGRAFIANGILVSSPLYFLAIWGGSMKGVKKVVGKIRNYLWSGSTNPSRTRVSWINCCRTKNEGGLGLINPMEAMNALMVNL